MDEKKIRQLLSRQEGVSIEFKRKMYEIDSPKPDTEKWEKGEMVRDILSLANGNVNSVGDTAYLIIGVGDEIKADGSRDFFDVLGNLPDQNKIIQKVKAFCDPPLDDISCEEVLVDGHRLFVFVIPPSPHLHETTRQLPADSRTFTESTVFIRHNEHIDVAKARERAEIERKKRAYNRSKRGIGSTLVGLIVGALVGGSQAANVSRISNESRSVGFLVGFVAFAAFGAGWGYLLGALSISILDWKSYSIREKLLLVGLIIFAAVWVVIIIKTALS